MYTYVTHTHTHVNINNGASHLDNELELSYNLIIFSLCKSRRNVEMKSPTENPQAIHELELLLSASLKIPK